MRTPQDPVRGDAQAAGLSEEPWGCGAPRQPVKSSLMLKTHEKGGVYQLRQKGGREFVCLSV